MDNQEMHQKHCKLTWKQGNGLLPVTIRVADKYFGYLTLYFSVTLPRKSLTAFIN